MPKVHFCKKLVNGNICGQRDPDNFESGRYSICKECKKKEIYAIQKSKREKEKLNEVISIDSVIKSSDIKDTVLKVPLLNGETIKENFEGVIRSIDDLRIKHNESINIMNLNITIFQKQQNDLQTKYDNLKEKYDAILKYCEEMKNHYFKLFEERTGPFIPKGMNS
jgi:hypothetical protein